jgi:hypothetical protein
MMAYNPYFSYQYPYQQAVQPNYQQTNQIQSGGLVSVRSVEEAYNYPVAPGNSITFKDETQPYVYTKTKGFSPLEQPVFEKYRLVKVDENNNIAQNTPKSPETAPDYEKQIKLLWDEVNALKSKIKGVKDDVQSADDSTVQAVHE